jgi:hypothetical protein
MLSHDKIPTNQNQKSASTHVFRGKLAPQAQELQYSTTEALSRTTSQGSDFGIDAQIMEMKQSDPIQRHTYLAAICAGGMTLDLDVMFAHPQELPELNVYKRIACNQESTWRSLLVVETWKSWPFIRC